MTKIQTTRGLATDASKQRKRASPNSTRDEILEVAWELFLARGYAGTSTSAIGKRLGISAAALYWHFASKEEILLTLLEGRLTDFVSALNSPFEDPLERLGDLVQRHVMFLLNSTHAHLGFEFLLSLANSGHVLTDEHQSRIRRLQRGVFDDYRATIASGRAQGQFVLEDDVAAAFAIINVCEGAPTWARPEGRLTPEEISEMHVAIALRIVGAA